jgi:hypothetical protein
MELLCVSGPYVMLVSGIRLGSPNAASLSAQLLVDFLGGRIGDDDDIELSRNVCRVIIAGDSIFTSDAPKEQLR